MKNPEQTLSFARCAESNIKQLCERATSDWQRIPAGLALAQIRAVIDALEGGSGELNLDDMKGVFK